MEGPPSILRIRAGVIRNCSYPRRGAVAGEVGVRRTASRMRCAMHGAGRDLLLKPAITFMRLPAPETLQRIRERIAPPRRIDRSVEGLA